MADQPLLEIRGLKKHFPIQKGFLRRTVGYIKAVDGVDLVVRPGETLSLVGESGSGKTTASRTAIRLYEPTAGEVWFRSPSLADKGHGARVDIARLDRRLLKHIRREISMVFQDPVNSLNPRMSVGEIIREPLEVHGLNEGRKTDDQVVALLEAVGLRAEHMDRYPHEFSGGQRQRIGIARALILRPSLVILDEPVSALDVSIQAQTLNLLLTLQEQFRLTYVFVAHDLSLVSHISDRVAVMYVGRVVEIGAPESMYTQPRHPYTEALLSAVPRPDPRNPARRISIEGQIPDPSNPPSGCYFHPRCRYARDRCKTDTPALREVAPDHFSACHFAEELALAGIGNAAAPS
jgi:peptide/nickel transport system ATP-binding protein